MVTSSHLLIQVFASHALVNRQVNFRKRQREINLKIGGCVIEHWIVNRADWD